MQNLIAKYYLKFSYGFRTVVINILTAVFFTRAQRPKRIIIHRVGAFGDSIVVMPALTAIRQYFYDATIKIISTQAEGVTLQDLVNVNAVADEIKIFPKGRRQEAWGYIKKQQYDLYIELPQNLNLIKSIRGIFRVRWVFGIKSAFGWDAGRIKRFLKYQKTQTHIARETSRFLKTVKKQGISGGENYALALSEVDRMAVQQYLTGNEEKIAFLIGSKYQAKKWPIKNWHALAGKLQDKTIIILGGDAEFSEAEKITEGHANITNLCGKTSLMETAAILEKVDSVISHDTGAMHLAYALKTPLVALFSTRELSNKWYPPQDSSIVIEKLVECSFCFKKDCAENICMQKIEVDEVLQALDELKRVRMS